jgi:hypothetical protein
VLDIKSSSNAGFLVLRVVCIETDFSDEWPLRRSGLREKGGGGDE